MRFLGGAIISSKNWDLYLYYGDRGVLEENYSMMKKWVEFLHSQAQDGILEIGKYGDWCPPWHIIAVETPISLVSTWYYYHDTLLFSQIAKILGNAEDEQKFSKRAGEIKKIYSIWMKTQILSILMKYQIEILSLFQALKDLLNLSKALTQYQSA